MRRKRPTLRGSVTQSTSTVRVRETSRFSPLMRFSIAVGVIVFIAVLGIWSWHSGWLHRRVAQIGDDILYLTQKANFAVNDIIVEGRQQTNKDQLYVALEATAGSPIFAFNPTEARARIAKLPWVENVVVERRLPDTIYVRLTERLPFARWQKDNHISVIDTNGKPLPDANPDQFNQLILLVGVGAPAEAKNLINTLHTFPAVDEKTVAAVRVSERRWDLHLQPKIVARLPDSDIANALKRLSILISEQKILERDIVAIDLRIPDRLIIEESPTAHPANGDNRQ